MIYQILAVDLGECAFAKVYTDGEIDIVWKDSSLVPNKTRHGGQSSHRYQQNRQNQITEWFREIDDKLKKVDGEIILAMHSVYHNRFIENLSTYNKAKIKERRTCEYSGITGIYQMVNQLEGEKKNKTAVSHNG